MLFRNTFETRYRGRDQRKSLIKIYFCQFRNSEFYFIIVIIIEIFINIIIIATFS